MKQPEVDSWNLQKDESVQMNVADHFSSYPVAREGGKVPDKGNTFV